ncbi:hypothetical protein [Streptomyces sp. SID13031]|uniref:hypothetical protein n=1 Tax=Streptomyces sp. SID13031 TaxID=2706046 RepID=UPI0013C65408|nr:hypothetical protein [Streptomyces sp. SID13031]NEA30844.1 hypothetical protein [Streptomyces sp. SID13031]
MGTQGEEAAARAELERVRTENAIKAMQREEEMRRLRDQQQNKMVATDPQASGQGWPDNEVRTAPGRLDSVAGVLGVGKAGDAAFAKRLLESGQAPAGSGKAASGAQAGADAPGNGAKARIAGAFKVQGATPAVER